MSSRFFNDRNAKQDTPTAVADGHSAGRKIDVEDAYLVLELQRGKHDALTILFEKYSGMVFDIARRILRGNSSEAEEVVQQVFLETYCGIIRDALFGHLILSCNARNGFGLGLSSAWLALNISAWTAFISARMLLAISGLPICFGSQTRYCLRTPRYVSAPSSCRMDSILRIRAASAQASD